MKCENCGNEYPNQYYFSTPTMCTECFQKLPIEEQRRLYELSGAFVENNTYTQRVGFGARLGASLIDIIISLPLILFVIHLADLLEPYLQILGNFPNLSLQEAKELQIIQLAIIPYQVIISVLYSSTEFLFGATPGKMILGLQIANDNGEKAEISELFMRWLYKHINIIFTVAYILTLVSIFTYLDNVLLIVIIIGFFFVLGERRQAFHDMIAKTAVFKKDAVKEKEN